MSAREMFKLDRPGKDGVSLRNHLETVERATGVRPDGLNVSEFPRVVRHVMGWFWELNSGRSSSGFGPNPISYAEISAWGSLTGTILRPPEIRILRAIDGAFLSVMNEATHG